MQKTNKPLSPIERLIAEKNDINIKCRLQEEKLNKDFIYIKENASSLLLSGLSSLIFSSGSDKKNSKKNDIPLDKDSNGVVQNNTYSVNDYLSIAKSLLPVAWEIIQPIIITWGINKAKSLLLGIFSKNKKPVKK